MSRTRIAVLLCLVLLFMSAAPAVAAEKAVGATASSSVTIEYDWQRVGFILYGTVESGDEYVQGTVSLEKSKDGETWSQVAVTTTGGQYASYSFTPTDTALGTYYRARFLGNDQVDPGLSREVRLGYDNPLIGPNARFLQPVAYDLKSLQSTRFRFVSGEPFTHAKLVVHGARSDGGDLVVFEGPVDATHDFDGITWSGRDEKGQRLRYSGNYKWTLTASIPNRTVETATGGVVVCRILFFKNSYKLVAGSPQSVTGYMVPGSAKVYMTASTPAAGGDTFSLKLTGPNGFSTATRNFLVDEATNIVTDYTGASAPRSRGVHTLTVSAKRGGAYRITVIQ